MKSLAWTEMSTGPPAFPSLVRSSSCITLPTATGKCIARCWDLAMNFVTRTRRPIADDNECWRRMAGDYTKRRAAKRGEHEGVRGRSGVALRSDHLGARRALRRVLRRRLFPVFA